MKKVFVLMLIFTVLAAGALTWFRSEQVIRQQNTYSPNPTTCQDPIDQSLASLPHPFQSPVDLLTIDRFFAWKDGQDLRPAIKDFFKRTQTDNTMIRVSIDIASRGYSDQEAAQDFATWTAETIDPSRASVMLGVLDSFFIRDYTVRKYAERTDLIAEAYSAYPATLVYEIGNEVNGEWAGPPELVIKKIQAADEVLCARNSEYLSSINFHYGSGDILTWIDDNLIPSDINNLSKRLDFVTISYYPEDVEQPRLTNEAATALVSELAKRFPNAAIGFGEIGFESLSSISSAQYKARLDELYSPGGSLAVNHPQFVGGGGIWNIGEAIEENRLDVLKTITDAVKNR